MEERPLMDILSLDRSLPSPACSEVSEDTLCASRRSSSVEEANFSSSPARSSTTPATSTRSSSPSSRSSRSRRVILLHASAHLAIATPGSIHPLTLRLRNQFLSHLRTLPDPGDASVNGTDGEPAPADLLAQFMSFVMRRMASDDDDGGEAARHDLLKVLDALLSTFEHDVAHSNDVHAAVASLPTISPAVKTRIIATVVRASHLLGRRLDPHRRPGGSYPPVPALVEAAREGRAAAFAVFGGQGSDTYFDSLVDLHATYEPLVSPLFSRASGRFRDLIRAEAYRPHFSKGLDFADWIRDPSTRPDTAYLSSAPVSFPLIGLLQLATFEVVARTLGLTPSGMLSLLSGTTGHSQGIVAAAVIAASSDWASFRRLSTQALTLLLSIGARSQSVFDVPHAHPSLVRDALDHGEGTPSPMLCLRHLPLSTVQALVDEVNTHLPPGEANEIGLHNGRADFVLAGPPASLHGLNVRLRALKAPPGDLGHQVRVPFNERKPRVSNKFLPVSAPFHSTYLSSIVPLVLQDARTQGITVRGSDLRIPVYATTADGADLRERGDEDVVPHLVRMIVELPLHWAAAARLPGATHVIDFGPGSRGGGGAGGLVHALKLGSGVRVLLAGELEGRRGGGDFGGAAELFDRRHGAVVYGRDWGRELAPRLVRTAGGICLVDTRMSRLLGLPPVMVAGMTPTTCCPSFVAAAFNAGFHAEFATGGYHDPAALEAALRSLADAVQPGRGITCNVIYANPTVLRWQIPLLRRLKEDVRLPIDGLTFGAGVPSIDVANEYIATFPGLKHVSFKPGSLDAIRQVVAIAAANPSFPVILQWTGGRSGGHHSFEDFHEPVVRMYAEIRGQKNIVLVAGSGMGDAEGSYPYLTGEWARKFGLPLMPFDGILLGSRVMVAKEAKTSFGAKRAITDAAGVDDAQWTRTLQGAAAGGVISVVSEMGEPIHKLATRGVQLWAELDKTIFSLPDKAERVRLLRSKKDYIIRRLNADFQKVWFGRSERSGEPVDLDEMTYAEVISRLIELMFVQHEKRWIDESLRRLTYDFICRVESRFVTASAQPSTVQSLADLDEPQLCAQKLFARFPSMAEDYIGFQDTQNFLSLCRRKGQKPVPFVPALDEHFETWFKKDSLWQSEDLEAVVGRDVGRVCILQGPVAVRYSKVVDEPIKDLLDRFHLGYIDKIRAEHYAGEENTIPFVECFGLQADEIAAQPDLCEIDVNAIKPRGTENNVSSSASDLDRSLRVLGGNKGDWRQAFFTSKTIVQDGRVVENPLRRIFKRERNMFTQVDDAVEPAMSESVVISLFESREDDEPVKMVEVRAIEHNVIQLRVLEERTANNRRAELLLKFDYRPELSFAPIHEIMEVRNERVRDFYRHLWFGDDSVQRCSVRGEFHGGPVQITADAIKQFARATENLDATFSNQLGKQLHASMDFAIVAAWKPLIQPLFAQDIQGDLLKLVHLSNGFRMVPDASPIVENDVIEAKSRVTAVINQGSGKMIEVCAQIFREGRAIMEVTSRFLYRGTYTDYENTFQITDETPIKIQLKSPSDVAVLKAKEWLHMNNTSVDSLSIGKEVVFQLRTESQPGDKGVFNMIRTTGSVEVKMSSKESVRVGSVEHTATRSYSNPVLNYLNRHGQPEQPRMMLANPLPLFDKSEEMMVEMPPSNENYAKASGDFNPIHVSKVLSQYVGLPGTITHGMYTSARVRGLIERNLCSSDLRLFRSFHCSFVTMVLPGDKLRVTLHHIGMVVGRKIIKVEATKKGSEETVLIGEAEVDAPKTAYVFTGQGSQKVGMGMDLYATSETARDIWDRADKHLFVTYGFRITDIVKNNPKKLVINFGGRPGRQIRQRYMDLTFDAVTPDGEVRRQRMFPEIDETSSSHTFFCLSGLLSATQFTQPALTIMEIAAFKDLRARGLVADESSYAGHSLGEYSALCAVADLIPLESLMSIVFYRGLTMQFAVNRDEAGRSEFAMCAVNPSRLSKPFDGPSLELLVRTVATATSCLLEVVNYNVAGQQYVCAGHLRPLKCLADALDLLHQQAIDLQALEPQQQADIVRTMLERNAPPPPGSGAIKLKRSLAIIPLDGIDVPFHSSYLRSGVSTFRHHLDLHIQKDTLDLDKLLGKYVPNLTAVPLEVSCKYFETVWRLTGSDVLREILRRWEEYENLEPGLQQSEALLRLIQSSRA